MGQPWIQAWLWEAPGPYWGPHLWGWSTKAIQHEVPRLRAERGWAIPPGPPPPARASRSPIPGGLQRGCCRWRQKVLLTRRGSCLLTDCTELSSRKAPACLPLPHPGWGLHLSTGQVLGPIPGTFQASVSTAPRWDGVGFWLTRLWWGQSSGVHREVWASSPWLRPFPHLQKRLRKMVTDTCLAHLVGWL